MILWELKKDADPEKLKNLVHGLLWSLRGKEYYNLTITEARLVNNSDLVSSREIQGVNRIA